MIFRIVAFLACSMIAFGQAGPVAAKPAPDSKVSTAAPVAPELGTAKLWRMQAQAQALRVQANQTEQAKAADAAEAEVNKEFARLSAICTDKGFVVGYQQDKNAENAGDLICVAKPKDPAPPAEKKKEN